MRLDRIRIASFGALRNWDSGDLGDLTVIHGKNEAGKTTIMSFLRRSMFPVDRRSGYPEPKKTDSGTLDATASDGAPRRYELSHKSSSEAYGNGPLADTAGLDVDSFNSMFAVDLEGLMAKDAMKPDAISRFLSIQGGLRMSEVMDETEKRMKVLLNPGQRKDDKAVRGGMRAVAEKRAELSAARSRTDGYDALATEVARLSKESDALTAEQRLLNGRKERDALVRMQKENMTRLSALAEEEKSLSSSEALTEDVIATFAALKEKRRHAVERSVAASEVLPDISGLGKDPATIMAFKDESRTMRNELPHNRHLRTIAAEELQESNVPDGTRNDTISEPGKRKFPALGIALVSAGAIMIAAGLLLLPAVAIAGAVAAVAGAAVTFAWLRKPIPETVRTVTVQVDKSAVRAEHRRNAENAVAEADAFDMRLRALCRAVGLEPTDPESDLDTIDDMVRIAEDYVSAKRRCDDLDAESAAIASEMNAFLRLHGTETDVERMIADRGRLFDVRRTSSELRESIMSATGMSVEDVSARLGSAETPNGTNDPGETIKRVNGEIGMKRAEMKALMDDSTIQRLSSELEHLERESAENIRTWGTLAIKACIIERSFEEASRSGRPEVLTDANRLLGLMTDGRYELRIDPSDNGIELADGTSVKRSGEWSSGLKDQVYLSMKMALAKSHGPETMPMILDDVLVRFDESRKMGACRAIAEYSRDRQVIIFTCDASIADMMRTVDSPTVVEL